MERLIQIKGLGAHHLALGAGPVVNRGIADRLTWSIGLHLDQGRDGVEDGGLVDDDTEDLRKLH